MFGTVLAGGCCRRCATVSSWCSLEGALPTVSKDDGVGLRSRHCCPFLTGARISAPGGFKLASLCGRTLWCIYPIALYVGGWCDVASPTVAVPQKGPRYPWALFAPCPRFRWPVEHYSRSPENPTLQLLQKSSKSASTTPQRPIWKTFGTVAVRDFWENGCMSAITAALSVGHMRTCRREDAAGDQAMSRDAPLHSCLLRW